MASISPLAQFSTCEISDALLKLNVPNAGHLSDINIFSPNSSTHICGPAYTVKMVLATDTAAPKLNQHFVDTAPQGSIIVIDAPSGMSPPSKSSLRCLTYYSSQKCCLGWSHDCRCPVTRRLGCGHLRSLS